MSKYSMQLTYYKLIIVAEFFAVGDSCISLLKVLSIIAALENFVTFLVHFYMTSAFLSGTL